MRANEKSPLQLERAFYQPKLPDALKGPVCLKEGVPTTSVGDQEIIKKLFPNTYGQPIVTLEKIDKQPVTPIVKVGVILSGGQAPGGHNVIAGLFDGLKALHSDNQLYGFLGGPSGLVEHKYIELTHEIIDEYRNTGGFDIIGSGRTKLEDPEQFDKGAVICNKLGINAIVIIGGDDSNTNACVLAEYYTQNKAGIQVIGCPKTIDGDLKNEMIETSFGFDTACKVYSELIGNIQRDANSSKKYYHFIRLMGRSASHIALECALETHPNLCIISEEVEAKQMTLNDIVNQIAHLIASRAKEGYNFGSILIPEGLIEFIPAMKILISELNDLLAHNGVFNAIPNDEGRRKYVIEHLSHASASIFESIPAAIGKQLTLDRDPHGNVQVSLIETEKLLIEMTKHRLAELKAKGEYKGKFQAVSHFFGYEGRCATPSNFDADYCYSLGNTASALISAGKTGYITSVRNLTAPANEWIAGGVPITMMMNIERRHGKEKPVIKKALVELDGAPFKFFAQHRNDWAKGNKHYIFPGPIQYGGSAGVCDQPTKTLLLEKEQE
jgi:pyrophosphate--fructose-6-phosphate 1-phosphotransferase